MPKKYRILTGHTFLDGDKTKVGGDTIELDDDMAAHHVGKIEPLPQDELQDPAPEALAPQAFGRSAE